MEKQDLGLEAWRSLLLAYAAALRAIDADIQRSGRVPLTWYDILLELKGGRGRLRMSELSERVVLSRTRISRLADEMAAAGLLRKETDETDRRVIWAVLTPAGKEALRKTAPVYRAGIDRHFASHLDESDLRTIAAALAKVVEAHDKGGCISCGP